jgi:hypothetical protein
VLVGERLEGRTSSITCRQLMRERRILHALTGTAGFGRPIELSRYGFT